MTEILVAEPSPAAAAEPEDGAVPDVLPAACGRCLASNREFADLLGHDELGHHAHTALATAGYVYTVEVALATDQELRCVDGLGADGFERVRERMPRADATPARYSPTILMHRLPDGLQLEPWMYVEPDKASALWCLAQFPAADHRVWPHVQRRLIAFSNMTGPWRDDERVLLDAARCFYGVGVGVDLSAAAQHLDAAQWSALLEAMRIRRDGSRSDS